MQAMAETEVRAGERGAYRLARLLTSLGRLWQCQGRCAEARQLVAEVYGWLTEGFETADLREAKALLEVLE
jgi:predicted ATPase